MQEHHILRTLIVHYQFKKEIYVWDRMDVEWEIKAMKQCHSFVGNV
jgi:hypothetical protein